MLTVSNRHAALERWKEQVVCATLSGAGMEQFKALKRNFDIVIIDEAAQAVELSALIPLRSAETSQHRASAH